MSTRGSASPAAGRSQSAETVAVFRAAHQLIDEEPLILRDPLALRIVGEQGERWVRENRALLDTERLRRVRGMVTVRSRVCEDALRRAVERGTRQYVVLGAGLDTFAYRSPELADRLTVFEVDQPATQAWKLARLREGGIDTPGNVRFVPVDFNEGTLAAGLAAAGFDRSAPAFFAWLGVSYYLPRDSVFAMLGFIGAQGGEGEVVFDYAVGESGVPENMRHLYHLQRHHMSTAPEPWQTRFEPDDLLAMLKSLGFTEIEHLDYVATHARFLAGRRDGLLPGPLVALVAARTRRA